MKTYKKTKIGNKSLVLIFSGWGTDEKAFKHLFSDAVDFIVFYDYRSIEAIKTEEFDKYDYVYIVAWSMGVMAAEMVLAGNSIKINKSIALCGSPLPVNNNYGIPERIFKLTVNGIKKSGTDKFYERMSDGSENSNFIKPSRRQQETIDELEQLGKYADSRQNTDFNWDIIVISKNDKIFPFQNLINYWENKGGIIIEDFNHYPFDKYDSIDKLFNL